MPERRSAENDPYGDIDIENDMNIYSEVKIIGDIDRISSRDIGTGTGIGRIPAYKQFRPSGFAAVLFRH